MSFQFNKNEEPIDLSKGGDNGTAPVARNNSESVKRDLPPLPGRALPGLPPRTEPSRVAPPVVPARAPLPTPPTRATPPITNPVERVPQPEPEAFRPPAEPTYQNPSTRVPEYDTGYQPQYNPNQQAPSRQEDYYREPERQQAPQQEQRYGNNGNPDGYVAARRNSPEAEALFTASRKTEVEEEEPKKKGFFSASKKPAKKGKNKDKDSSVKVGSGKSQFAGDRRKVLIARVVVFSILGILIVSGIASFLPKQSGLTTSDGPLIISKVRENLGVTDFPKTAGEGMALGFSKTYLNYDSASREARATKLGEYVSTAILNNIDIRPASADEIAAANATVAPAPGEELSTSPSTTGPATQTVTEGPYLIKSTMLKYGEAAVFTTKTEVNGNTWLYMQVPMFYDKTKGTLSVSGSPTFVNPINVAAVPQSEYTLGWTGDRVIEDLVRDDLSGYMRAWAASDTTTIERLTIKKDGKNAATSEALTGLNGSVKLVRMSDLSVEQKPALKADSSDEEKAGFNTRQAQITVLWLEPQSGTAYSQNYRLVLQYANDDWFIADIQNVTTLIDRDALATQKADNPDPATPTDQ
jgi:hypothetical protein